MTQAYFITGTDTGVGKTYVSTALVRHFVQQGKRVVGMKPIASGCETVDGELKNEDALQLQAASNVEAPYQRINPYAFAPAIAPHIAAQQAGVEIQRAPILQAYQHLTTQADVVIVEGAGGFLVPLSDTLNTADLIHALNIPVILVVGIKLGCINHALLTAEAIRTRGLTLAGWVANCIEPEMPHVQENIEAINQRINTPCLGTVAWGKTIGLTGSFL